MRLALGLVALTMTSPVTAQETGPAVRLGVDATSDLRRRGLGWSDGAAAAGASAAADIAGFRLDARAATLRGSARHGGADAVADLSAGIDRQAGAWRLSGGVTGHLFAGARGRMDYVEIDAGVGTTVGPVGLDLRAAWAPDQSAIGGDNLYLGGQARVAVVGTPVTLIAGLGRSIGSGDGPRAARLRPDGDYTDWRLGAEWIAGAVTVGVDYTGTDVSRAAPGFGDPRNSGDRLLVRAGLSF